MIEKSVRIHDKFSLELKFGYSTRRKLKENLFEVNTWIFIPNSLDINRQTYDKSDFYKDLKSNIRLITPEFLLRDIADKTKSPFIHLEASFNALAVTPTRSNARNYEHQIKMFNSILKSSLRDHRLHIIRNIETEDRDYLISNYLQSSREILSNYRSLRHIIAVPTVRRELFSLYILGDEFMSNLIEQHTFLLADEIRKNHPELYRQTGPMLTELIRGEVEYRRSKGFPTAENLGREEIREKKRDGFIAEQLIYSIAAGFAMIFATAIAFIFQKKFGNFTIPLFVALVISYMLKDRIKELTRYYFAGKLKKVFFDHKTRISVTPDKSVGWCKESFDFVSAEKVPADILAIRAQSLDLEVQSVSGWERVVLYRKLMKLDRPSLDGIFTHYTITGVNDIIRFNVSNFVHNMDNPEIPFRILAGDDFEEISGQKVYYLTFVINVRYDGENQVYLYRVTFNRSGILKVDSL